MIRTKCKHLDETKICMEPRCDACFDFPAPEYCAKCRFFEKGNEGERHFKDKESPQTGGRMDRL